MSLSIITALQLHLLKWLLTFKETAEVAGCIGKEKRGMGRPRNDVGTNFVKNNSMPELGLTSARPAQQIL